MRRFADLPIRSKLTRLVTVTTVSALLLALAGFALRDAAGFVSGLRRLTTERAVIFAAVVAAPLAFDDPGAAALALSHLRNDPRIVRACVYDVRGDVFAEYVRRDEGEGCPVERPTQALRRGLHRLMVVAPVELEGGEAVGSMLVETDFGTFYDRMLSGALVSAGVLAVALLFALLFARRLQRSVADPILELAAAAREVPTRAGYSVRVPIRGDDEIGELTESFNWMVEQVATRDAAVRESEQLLQAIIDNASAVIVMKDREGRYLLVNRMFEEQFGVTREQFRGRTDHDLLPAAEAAAVRANDEIVLASREPVTFEETVSHGGEKRTILAIKFPLFRGGEPSPYALCAIGTDITERIRAQVTSEERNRDLETLLYVVSHDLREPLRSIDNFSRMVNERYADRLDDRGKDYLRRVVRAAGRLDRLLQEILTLSRAQRMSEPEAREPAAAVVAEALRLLDTRIRETDARISVAGGLPHLRINRRWAIQAVYNLVSNALKFTRDGRRPEIEILPFREGTEVGLVIADRGPGVDAEHQEMIFRLFQRAVGREVDGTGAGLAIVQQIASRHGGRTFVRPRTGGGSEFVITFGTGLPED
jgi:PAS domain S-box-containing protein